MCRRLYLDANIVIDLMEFELKIKPTSHKKHKKESDRWVIIESNIKKLNIAKSKYQLAISIIALGEVVRYIIENGKGEEYFRWLYNFLNDYKIDILPITKDMVYRFDDDYSIFTIAKKIVSEEIRDPNEWWGGKTLDGNDALILAQAILDENAKVLLTTDNRMIECVSVDFIEKEINRNSKLNRIKDLAELL